MKTMLQLFGGGKRTGRLLPLTILSLFSLAVLLLLAHFHTSRRKLLPPPVFHVDPEPATVAEHNATPRIACMGPRGKFLDDAHVQDLPRAVRELDNVTFPVPTTGSYEVVGLDQSWLTAEERYGPYGFGEDDEKAYMFSRVDWAGVDWGRLQDDCLAVNEVRFGGMDENARRITAKPRFRLAGDDSGEDHESSRVKTGRQAIVLRVWSTFEYTPEDLWNVRSIVNEASLATGGEYTVFLLVDVKNEDGAMIHKDDDFYEQVLARSVPHEFRNMAVLFHESLLESWYAKVEQHRPVWQIMQPFQLFAHFYSEFDHYWQIEMDTRFTSHVGSMLHAFHSFTAAQPYKQARERSSWTYFPELHGTYEEFSQAINETMDGTTPVWGAVTIPQIEPSGPVPPVKDPTKDNFEWGVGQEADLVLLGQLNDVTRFQLLDDWVFKDYVGGGLTTSTPRLMSVPAQARASYNLLEATHRAQRDLGLCVPAEATLPSFALWNGLKTVSVPLPKFQFPTRDLHELAFILNGGGPRDFSDGIARGPGQYRSSSTAFFTRPMTWDWASSLCDPVFEHWMKRPGEAKGDRPPFLAASGGVVWAPGFIMHPRKTNNYVS